MVQNLKLQNLFKLSSKVTVYVPSTIDINVNIDNTEYVNKTAELLSDCFGGATQTNALGCWKSPTAGLVKEKVVLVYSNCTDNDLNENIEKVVDWCEKMRDELRQDAISLEINGELYFI